MNFEVYCDESRPELMASGHAQGRAKYIIIGSMWIKADLRQHLKREIAALRAAHNVHGEFKWKRVSPSRLVFYRELVDLFFREDARFRCIVLPADQLDAIQFHDGDNELMFYKFYYMMLRGWILDFNQYRIFTDIRTNRVGNRLQALQSFLTQVNLSATVEAVQALPSEQVDLLQLVDMLLGVVSYYFNSSGRSGAKLSLVEHIEAHIGHPIQPTGKAEEKFNVFRWRPGGGW